MPRQPRSCSCSRPAEAAGDSGGAQPSHRRRRCRRREGRGIPLPEPGHLRRHRSRGDAADLARRHHQRLLALDRRRDLPSRPRPCCRPSRRPTRTRCRPGFNIALAERAAHREVVRQRAEGHRPAAPARGLGAVADLRGVAGRRAAEPAVRHRRLPRHAGARRVRRFPQAARGRDAAPGDGRLPLDARQPEGRGRHQPAPRRELRARGDAADVDRPGGAEPRRHARSSTPHGQPIPTYDQAIIEGFARVFTGWNWACPTTLPTARSPTRRPQLAPVPATTRSSRCSSTPTQHETGTKQLLRTRRASSAHPRRARAAQQDLQDALDNIFNHPNVGPFISKQLIQKLVTSNPSPAYVQRVAAEVQQRRHAAGAATWRPWCARSCSTPRRARAHRRAAATAGKIKEPLLRLTQFWRAYDGKPTARRRRVRRRNFAGGVRRCSARGRGCRRRCSTSSARSTRRPARSRTRAWSRRSCSSPPNT